MDPFREPFSHFLRQYAINSDRIMAECAPLQHARASTAAIIKALPE